MGLCEMCGRESQLLTANVEGVEMNLCPGCSRYGSVKKQTTNRVFTPSRRVKKDEPQFRVVRNYSNLLKSSREKKGLSQEEFAKFLQEKVSIVAKWESGKLRPSVGAARRLGRLLDLNLVESETTEVFEKKKSRHNDYFTLGDFIKARKPARK